MTTIGKIQRSTRPARSIVLSSSAFADEYDHKPAGDVAIGLRLVSQADYDAARREAEREASGFYHQFDDVENKPDDRSIQDIYNDAFLANIAARATCDPNNVNKPYFPFADDTIRKALTPEGLRRIWDELVILHKGSGPSRREASDDEIQRLCAGLGSMTLDTETRRLLGYLFDKLEPTLPADEAAKDEPGEEDGVYYARTA